VGGWRKQTRRTIASSWHCTESTDKPNGSNLQLKALPRITGMFFPPLLPRQLSATVYLLPYNKTMLLGLCAIFYGLYYYKLWLQESHKWFSIFIISDYWSPTIFKLFKLSTLFWMSFIITIIQWILITVHILE